MFTFSVMGNRNTKITDVLCWTSGILILASLVLILSPFRMCVPIVYFLGACLFVSLQYNNRPKGQTTTFRRLCRIQQIGDILLMLTAVPLAMNIWQWPITLHGEWLLILTIAAWLELYTIFRMDALLKRR